MKSCLNFFLFTKILEKVLYTRDVREFDFATEVGPMCAHLMFLLQVALMASIIAAKEAEDDPESLSEAVRIIAGVIGALKRSKLVTEKVVKTIVEVRLQN